MKKILIMVSILGFSFSPFNSSLYQLSCKGIDHQLINLAAFKGRKILIAVIDAGKLNRTQLLSLDSLQHSGPVAVIAVPVTDFNGALPEVQLRSLLQDSLKLSFPVTEISKAQKKQGSGQTPLLGWLTHRLQNGHFDQDIEEAGQLFVISESGVLYATLKGIGLPNGGVVRDIIAKHVTLSE
ncbi:hypothetical protein [Asinibacterium sp. OR53]|uniref:hypothetical protein n=1 Tax=Asinibacterium sp. OR53 TaxID=925409 RepID=UPI0012FA2B38|nr:hypothetical protein [Asinibacterium sp. OR53]